MLSTRTGYQTTIHRISSQTPCILFAFHPYESIEWVEGSTWANLTGINQGTPWDCVDVSTRGINGAFGEATTVCRGDVPLFSLRGEVGPLGCTVDGLTVDEIPVKARPIPSPKAGGCAVGGTSLPASRASWLGVFGFALLLRVRRRSPQPRA